MKATAPNAIAASLLCITLSACGGGGATETNEPLAPVAGAAELRVAIEGENLQPLPAAPTVSDELFALGQALFFDKVLSGNQGVSCATCHWPELATGDDRTLPRGVGGIGLGSNRLGGAIVPRNSPTVLNTHMLDEVFWDGRISHAGATLVTPAGATLSTEMRAFFDPQWELLAAQAMFPPTSRDEMRGAVGENDIADVPDADFQGIWDALRDRLIAFRSYQDLFLNAYPALSSIAEIEFAHAANALAAFEVRAFAKTDSPFERFVRGDANALTEEQVRGGREFFGSGNCVQCHSGSRFTDQDFHNIGLPQLGPGKGDGVGGVEDFGREGVTNDRPDRYRFRTPSLLNVALTAPYGHAGQYASLRNMVQHYTNPTQRLGDYSILNNVSDPDLTGTLVSNQAQILGNLSNRVRNGRRFDVDAVVTFLGALTADDAVNMANLIPGTVPSGLSLR